MKSRKQPNCPIEVGARTVAVCHLGNIAYLHAAELDFTHPATGEALEIRSPLPAELRAFLARLPGLDPEILTRL